MNAVTADGEIVNLDGSGNRVAATCFGPGRVIYVVGINKLCFDLEEAISRVRNFVAPANAMRLEHYPLRRHRILPRLRLRGAHLQPSGRTCAPGGGSTRV